MSSSPSCNRWERRRNGPGTGRHLDLPSQLPADQQGARCRRRTRAAGVRRHLGRRSRLPGAAGKRRGPAVRHPFAMLAAQFTLAEAYPQRFLLGLGVSHARMVEGKRGHHYQRPVATMRSYLDAMDRLASSYRAVRPASTPPRVLAALGPKMLALAAEQ